MTATIAEAAVLHLDVTEFDRIVCTTANCGAISAYFTDGDGEHDAQDDGWHVAGMPSTEECGCDTLCEDCAHDQCGMSDTTPRLRGMRVV